MKFSFMDQHSTLFYYTLIVVGSSSTPFQTWSDCVVLVRTRHEEGAGLEQTSTMSTSQVLALQMCTTKPSVIDYTFYETQCYELQRFLTMKV